MNHLHQEKIQMMPNGSFEEVESSLLYRRKSSSLWTYMRKWGNLGIAAMRPAWQPSRMVRSMLFLTFEIDDYNSRKMLK